MSIYEYDDENHLRMEREQSFAEGMESGKVQEQFRVVMKMCEKGLNPEQISNLTGISSEEIEKMLKEK